MRILGIDPGYATIGFGMVESSGAQVRMVTYGAITTPQGYPFPDGSIRSAQIWRS